MGRLQRVLDFVTFNDLPAARIDAGPAAVRAIAPIAATPGYQVGKALWPTAGPQTYVKSYGQIVTAYRCVNLIANAVGSAPVRVYAEETGALAELPAHPIRQLLRAPNPFLSEAEFLNAVVKIAAATGVCVIEKERSAGGRVIGLWPLRTDWLRPVPRGDGSHDWRYELPDGRRYDLPAEDVIAVVYEADPFGSPFGIAPMAAALRELAIESSLIEFTKTFLQRGAVPQYGLIPREAADLTQEEADALRERWQQRYGGITNSAEVAVLSGIEDVRRIGLDYNELAYADLRSLTQTQICSAFGVPPILIGAKPGLDASTYSNYEQARRAFWEDTITPLLARLDGALTRGLLAEFADRPNLTLGFDTSDVPALQSDEGPAWTRVGAAVAQGWLTVNDARREVGLPEVGGGDVFLRSIAASEIPADGQRAALREVELRVSPLERLTRGGRVAAEERRRIGAHNRTVIAKLGQAQTPKVQRFLRGQRERVIAALDLRGGPGPEAVRANVEAIDWSAENELLREVLAEVYRAAGYAAYGSAQAIGLDVSWSLANPRISDIMGSLGTLVRDINETTRQAINEVVTEALLEGLPMTSETGDSLSGRLKGLYDETYRGRSETIARTESQVAYNRASTAAYLDSGVVDRVELMDNPEHDSDPGMDGLTCAQRDGFVTGLENAWLHIAAEHPRGTLAVAPVVMSATA